MDVKNVSAADPAGAGIASGPPRAGSLPGSVETGQHGSLPSEAPIAALIDRVDIHTLDVAAALQILIAEVRVELGLSVGAATLQGGQGAEPAARQLVQMFLQALPSTPDVRSEATLLLAMDRAVDIVGAWRDASEPVIETAKSVRALVVNLLSDDPPSLLWAQPQWLALAPRMQRYWRRRRRTTQASGSFVGPHQLDEHMEAAIVADKNS